MITIRFQTGVTVTYNHAHYVVWNVDGNHRIYTQKDGSLIAIVPGSAIVEFQSPNKFENPIEGKTVDAAIRLLTTDAKALRTAPTYFVHKLKGLLSDFNAKTHQWKEIV